MGGCVCVSPKVGPGRSVWSHPHPCAPCACSSTGWGIWELHLELRLFKGLRRKWPNPLSVWSAQLCAAPALGDPEQEGIRDVVTLSFSHLVALAMRLSCGLWIQCALCATRGFAWLLFLLNPQSFVNSRAWSSLCWWKLSLPVTGWN